MADSSPPFHASGDALPTPGRRLGQDAAKIAGFLVLYVALDWVSVIEPFGALGITPWNPPAGLIVALFLLYGSYALLPVFAAVALADVLLRGVSTTPFATLSSAVVISLCYGWSALLLREKIPFSRRLTSHQDLLSLLATTLGATVVIALIVVWIFCTSGLVPWPEFWTVTLRYWTGDVIGITVFTPFILLLFDREHRQTAARHWMTAEAALQLAAIALGLWIIFGLERIQHFEYSYVLFLPLIWIALRHGLMGATWGIVTTQLGMIAAIQMRGYDTHIVTQFQLLMLAVTISGLFLGAVVDERRRAERGRQEHEAQLAHAARFSTTGELAAAIAHELNQPLTAVIGFARACQGVLQKPNRDAAADQAAIELIENAVQQATRAGKIIRSTREFLKRDDLQSVKVALGDMIETALDLIHAEAAQNNVRIVTKLDRALPPVLVDPIQIEQVILNLLHNSIEAMVRAGSPVREITLSAGPAKDDKGYLEIAIGDSGPGFAPEVAERLFQPFSTTKTSGMGLGLSISRSLIEAHGGKIWVAPMEGQGAAIRFTLPVMTDDAL